jgi:hypothetical protein
MALSLLCAGVALPAAEQAQVKSTEAAALSVAKPAAASADSARTAAPAVVNRVELDTTQITGNRELPRVLYVVPWKRADLGESSGKPAKSLLDEVLAPVDRDVFRRQNRYHEALQPDTAAPRKTDAATGER